MFETASVITCYIFPINVYFYFCLFLTAKASNPLFSAKFTIHERF